MYLYFYIFFINLVLCFVDYAIGTLPWILKINSSVSDRMLLNEESWYLMIAQDLGWMKESILAVGVFGGRIMNVESIKCTFNNESIKILQCLTYLLYFLKIVHDAPTRRSLFFHHFSIWYRIHDKFSSGLLILYLFLEK